MTLAQLRKEKKYTQLEVAEIVGINRLRYQRWESGKITLDNISFTELLKLSIFFEVSCEELLRIGGVDIGKYKIQ